MERLRPSDEGNHSPFRRRDDQFRWRSVPLRQVDKRLNPLTRFAECFLDGRNRALVEHSIAEMLAQRVYGLALGYEDLNDHEQ